jgi:hypothetical protein
MEGDLNRSGVALVLTLARYFKSMALVPGAINTRLTSL